MSVREYIGARYVPVFADPIQWDPTLIYEPLTVVTDQGASYVSRRMVPEGIQLDNTDYWVLWADFNAQLQHYIDEVDTFDGRIDALEDALPIADFSSINTIDGRFDTLEALLPASAFDSVNTVDARFDTIEANSWVTSTRIADDAVTTVKIADANVTTAKLPDEAVTTAKIADGAVTAAKIADGSILNKIKGATNILTPEMFGALGGDNDDSTAFQNMFNAATDKNVIVLTKAQYTIKQTINITNDFISMVGLGMSELNPNINFEIPTPYTYGFYIAASGVHFENIRFNSDTRDNGTYLLGFDKTDIDAIISNCVFGYAYNHIYVKGRNINVHNCLFSSWLGDAVYIADAAMSNARGYIFNDNRFHAGYSCVNTSDVTYNTYFGLEMSNNYIDGCAYMYRGITDNVVIKNNSFRQHNGDSIYPIYFTRTRTNSSHVVLYVYGNTFDDTGASTRLEGMLIFNDATHSNGVIVIANNYFDCQYTDPHAVMIVRGGEASVATFIVIKGNVIRTANTGTPIQVTSPAAAALKGYIDGNFICTTGTSYITNGGLTLGVNYTTRF